MNKKIYAIALFLIALVFMGCGAGNSKAQPKEKTPETLEITYMDEGEHSIHYILHDKETGCEYIVVVWEWNTRGGSVSITPRLRSKEP